MSVDIESLIKNYEVAILDNSIFHLYKIKTELPHSIDLTCLYDPMTIANNGFDNQAHSIIIGFDEEDESKSAILAKNAIRLPYPMG